jgi:uncharacterized protein (TIGR02391 family)
MIEQIQTRIDRLNDVGQHAFGGTDYSFGFNAWRGGTLTLLRRLFPSDRGMIEQIENINLVRIDHNRPDSLAYNLGACKKEAREILTTLIETLKRPNDDAQAENSQDFWALLHPRVTQTAKSRFEGGHFADSVLACLRDINTIVKDHVKRATTRELDGASLMTFAFSLSNPLIRFGDMSTESDRNIQLGYMKIFEGAMLGIRNPNAHANLFPDRNKTIHLLFIASFLFLKLQDAGILNEELGQ